MFCFRDQLIAQTDPLVQLPEPVLPGRSSPPAFAPADSYKAVFSSAPAYYQPQSDAYAQVRQLQYMNQLFSHEDYLQNILHDHLHYPLHFTFIIPLIVLFCITFIIIFFIFIIPIT